MIQKPKFLARKYAEQFQDTSIVKAYRHRPPYPLETFEILAELVQAEPRRVLDVGCGSGFLSRQLIEHVEQVDAVDFSEEMLKQARRLPNGDNPGIHWLLGSVEEISLNPPYGLVTAGESLHWMDWNVVLPRFRELLVPGGYLAVVGHDNQPDPWFELLRTIITKYSTNKDFQAYDMLAELEKHGLFKKVGEKTTQPVSFSQSLDDYIESYHSRNGFSRDRMEPAAAATFDREAKEILLKAYPNAVVQMQVVATISWGLPNPG
ncbi:MAG TPA: class I SAM-dependent methyltransferase [Ktedonobacteraceae bacterium]|nr:class I SAM-dependent methyltransferase [Ktedonobacteraceae bacterium]